MSINEIRRFAGDMERDAALRAEAERHVRSSQAPLEGFVAFAAGKGYGFTVADVEQGIRPAGGTLSEGELDRVAAGGGWNSLLGHPGLFPLAVLLGLKG